ncbi:MAG: ABC transporter ATP-binding protein [Granulosicoccus sp.]|nr:ABC transporter ATP-binding protein [Granulosicoccus sp.]
MLDTVLSKKLSEKKLTPNNSAPIGRVDIIDVSVTYGSEEDPCLAVADTNLTIEAGEFVCILGPSGCGKSTLLNTVAGYVKPTTGSVTIDGKAVTGPGPDRGMVFQQYSLLPWKTVYQNVAFGPRMAGKNQSEAGSLANTFLSLVGLSKFADRYPSELSGGMQQRVGIARALANYPSVLLMDEPFGALDSQTRIMMQENLLSIWKEFGTTVLFITHDVDEAVYLADRVLVMSAGPGSIIGNLPITLPRPRTPEVIADPVYVSKRTECLSLIRNESLRAFEEQNA